MNSWLARRESCYERERAGGSANRLICNQPQLLTLLYWKSAAINNSRTFYSALTQPPHHHSHNYGNRRKLITVTTQYKTLSKVRSCITSEPYLPTALSFRWTITVMNWRNIGGHRKTQGVKGWLTPFLSFQPTCGETLLLSNWCVLIYVILQRAWLLWIILTLVAERHKV